MLEIYDLKDLQCHFPKMNFDWRVKLIPKILIHLEKEWRFVGGCVRDSLLGIETIDIDLNTVALPDEIEGYFVDKCNTFNIGKKFGTIGLIYKKYKIEITTNRTDVCTYGRKADVQFTQSFEEDSERRDFTINALMLDQNGKVFDYHNGLKHLQQQKVIFINNPIDRIKEDYLRMIRYIRFFVRFDQDKFLYYNEIQNNLSGLENVSVERVLMELESMCKNANLSQAIQFLNQLGISDLFFHGLLNTNIDDNLPLNYKFILIFWLLDLNVINQLPLTKSVKYFLNFKSLKYQDVFKNFAYFWNKNHSLDLAKEFITFIQLTKVYDIADDHLNHLMNFQTISLVDKSILEEFQGPIRTKAEITFKYLLIKNLTINLENLQYYLQEF